jgi:hypothetical protein
MCDPVTMTIAGVQAFSQIQQGRQAGQRADEQGRQLDRQAAVEADNAQAEASRIRRAGDTARGQTVGAYAASGVKVGEGSALEAERQVMQDYEQDAYMAILTGQRRAGALQEEAASVRRAGRDARRAGYISAGTSLLSAGASGMRAGGWRANGPGFSGGQAPAPVYDRYSPDAILLTRRGSGD